VSLAAVQQREQSDEGGAVPLVIVSHQAREADVQGAIAAWQDLLKQNPNHPRRVEVEQLMSEAKQHANIKMPGKPGGN